MKNVSLLFVLLVFLSPAFAQQKAIAKAVIQTPGLQDQACKDRIEQHLFKEDGIATVKADFHRHTVTVSWFKDRTNIENIKTSIANTGYDADDVTKDEDAYKRLPKTCQHVVAPKPVPAAAN